MKVARSGAALDTRKRILEISLELFNRKSFARVSTAEIAAAAGIRQGNLWYHFRAKSDLVLAHLDWLDEALSSLLSAPLRHPGPGLIAEFKESMRRINAFRYLLRDHIPELEGEQGEERVRALLASVEARVEARMKASVDAGLMKANAEEIRHLAITAVVLMRYWLEYVRSRDGTDIDEEAAFERGIVQLGQLLRPYLSGAVNLLLTNRR